MICLVKCSQCQYLLDQVSHRRKRMVDRDWSGANDELPIEWTLPFFAQIDVCTVISSTFLYLIPVSRYWNNRRDNYQRQMITWFYYSYLWHFSRVLDFLDGNRHRRDLNRECARFRWIILVAHDRRSFDDRLKLAFTAMIRLSRETRVCVQIRSRGALFWQVGYELLTSWESIVESKIYTLIFSK